MTTDTIDSVWFTGRNVMAGSPSKTSVRSRSGATARSSAGARKTGATKARASKQAANSAAARQQSASKRTARKPQGRTRVPQPENWAASVGTLLTSDLSREILAEVLNAAAGVLRQNRQVGQQVQNVGQAMLGSSAESASSAV